MIQCIQKCGVCIRVVSVKSILEQKASDRLPAFQRNESLFQSYADLFQVWGGGKVHCTFVYTSINVIGETWLIQTPHGCNIFKFQVS